MGGCPAGGPLGDGASPSAWEGTGATCAWHVRHTAASAPGSILREATESIRMHSKNRLWRRQIHRCQHTTRGHPGRGRRGLLRGRRVPSRVLDSEPRPSQACCGGVLLGEPGPSAGAGTETDTVQSGFGRRSGSRMFSNSFPRIEGLSNASRSAHARDHRLVAARSGTGLNAGPKGHRSQRWRVARSSASSSSMFSIALRRACCQAA
jgi:hypothetical protein